MVALPEDLFTSESVDSQSAPRIPEVELARPRPGPEGELLFGLIEADALSLRLRYLMGPSTAHRVELASALRLLLQDGAPGPPWARDAGEFFVEAGN